MDDQTFRAFLDLMMCADPWPVRTSGDPIPMDMADAASQSLLVAFADSESRARGYDGWIVAYHEFTPSEFPTIKCAPTVAVEIDEQSGNEATSPTTLLEIDSMKIYLPNPARTTAQQCADAITEQTNGILIGFVRDGAVGWRAAHPRASSSTEIR